MTLEGKQKAVALLSVFPAQANYFVLQHEDDETFCRFGGPGADNSSGLLAFLTEQQAQEFLTNVVAKSGSTRKSKVVRLSYGSVFHYACEEFDRKLCTVVGTKIYVANVDDIVGIINAIYPIQVRN
jgi:hypothetical protein